MKNNISKILKISPKIIINEGQTPTQLGERAPSSLGLNS